ACRESFGLPARSAELLTGGLLNQSWRVRADDHDRVLRVGRPERDLDQVRYEYRLAAAWAEEIPQVIVAEHAPGHRAGDHLLTLFRFVDGVDGSQVRAATRNRQLAPVMARMHRIAVDLGLPQRPGYRSIDEQPMSAHWGRVRSAIVDRFGATAEVGEPASAVDRAVDQLDQQLDGWRSAGRLDHRAAVHGDLNTRNQLYRNGRLVGIIDIDECRVEPLIWEVAGMAYTDPSVDPQAVWRQYLDAGGPLPPEDGEMLESFARLGALGELQWFLDDEGKATHLALDKLWTLAAELGTAPVRG
ncbi:MAG TPA: phosphotransferase, partial [Microlunatus sp.]